MLYGRAARKKTNITEVDAKILELQKLRKELQAKQAERLGRLAMAAGVSDFEVPDEELTKAFEEVAENFRVRFCSETDQSKPTKTATSIVSDPAVSSSN